MKKNNQTLCDLDKRIQSIHGEKQNDILVRFDGSTNEQSFQYIQQLSKYC